MDSTSLIAILTAAEQGIDWKSIVFRIASIDPELVINAIKHDKEPAWADSVRLASQHGLVSAVKKLREHSNWSLVDAKRWVENDSVCMNNVREYRSR